MVAVRWYLRYGLSYRDVEELLAERGIEVDHVTIYRWVQRFTPLLADAARFARHSPGVWCYVYRAVDEHHRSPLTPVPDVDADSGGYTGRVRIAVGMCRMCTPRP